VLVEPRQSTSSTNDHEIIQYELRITRNELLSSLTKTDHCSMNFSLGSTRNAPKMLNESPMLETCTDEVYAISQDNGSDKEMDKPKKTVLQNLTPVIIMAVDTISSVRSRRLRRVLFDSGSTTTLISKICLPRHCKPCKISSSRKVNTLAGTYTSMEIVIMHNLRLLEFDKNRNVNQQKALLFQSETCKYDVILGPDFLTITGIDAKYGTGTIEWFNNELPLRNPHLLNSKELEPMAECGKPSTSHSVNMCLASPPTPELPAQQRQPSVTSICKTLMP
jgi:hypothetical protein